MKRITVALALSASLLGAAACGGSDNAQPTPGTPPATESDSDILSQMPTDTAVVSVPVTKPAAPSSVVVAQLPMQAQLIDKSPIFTTEEKACANYAVKDSLDKDPSITQVNGRVAGLIGGAIQVCTGPERLGTVLTDALKDSPTGALPPEGQTCVKQTVAANPSTGATLLGALFTVSPEAVDAALKPFAKCGVKSPTAG